jgi:N-acetylglutamate synthase-like GNAT family acetyltransferase
LNFAPPISTFARVDTSSSGARRATVDDLPSLQALWIEAGQPWEELEKLLAEFQVVADEDGSLLAAVGLLVEGSEGLLHTETVAARAGEEADELRAQLWRRIQIVARNQGVVRLWTAEDAPYWATEFSVAPAATVEAAGAGFLGNDLTASWRVRELVDPNKARQLVNEQMAIWSATRAQEQEQFQRKTRTFMLFALVLVAAIIGTCAWMIFRVMSAQPDLLQRIFRGGR